MAEYRVVVDWQRGDQAFTDGRYSRAHHWGFDGGAVVEASSSPHVVPLPMSVEEAVDPEEAFVASLSSCHMLSFLYVAWKRGFVIDSYRDEAVGILQKDVDGQMAMTRVTLYPEVRFSQEPSADELEAMHHEAHEACFIARSVKTDVRCEPRTPASV